MSDSRDNVHRDDNAASSSSADNASDNAVEKQAKKEDKKPEPTFEQLYAVAKDTMDVKGDAVSAYKALGHLLKYPAKLICTDAQWTTTLSLFARISAVLTNAQFMQIVTDVVQDPSNPEAWFQLGFEMVDQRQNLVAASFLKRALELAPEKELMWQTVSELAVALEREGWNKYALKYLENVRDHFATTPVLHYLYAVNAALCGNMELAQAASDSILSNSNADDRTKNMCRSIVGAFLERYNGIKATCKLNHQDLRSWQYVLTGSLLLHISPYGFNEGMNGRYAFITDSYERCLEGITKLKAVLQELNIKPTQVQYIDNRDSKILATATAKVLGLDLALWVPPPDKDPQQIPDPDTVLKSHDEPATLLVIYDWCDIPPTVRGILQQRKPNQIMWCHADAWRDDRGCSPDVVTYLYQFNITPWDTKNHIRVPKQGEQETVHEEHDDLTDPDDVIVGRVVNAELSEEYTKDLPELLQFVKTAVAATESTSHGLALLGKNGWRSKKWVGSPVPSSYFT